MTFPFPAAAPPNLRVAGALTYVGTDRTTSADGDIIYIIQYGSSIPATPTGYTSIVTAGPYGGALENASGDWVPDGSVACRICYAVSSSATRTVSISGLVRTLVVGSPYGSGSSALSASTVSPGTVSTSGYNECVGFVEIGVTGQSTGGRFYTANYVPGSVDSASRDQGVNYVVAVGRDDQGSFDAEISLWQGNYVPNNSATLASGSGSDPDDTTSTVWHALSLA